MIRVAVPKEIVPGERRVALVPESIESLSAAGLQVAVESDAGHGAGFVDAAYTAAGAQIVADVASLYAQADVVLKLHRPLRDAEAGEHEADRLREGAVCISFLQPATDPPLVRRLAQRRVTAFSMDLVPRITRAQKMDALSSQSTAAGYRAALLGATTLGRFFPMLMTAAGTIAPARVLVLGAGVAGLQAIATARRLGAVVQAFDIRPAVKEQVESLGATFVGMTVEESQDAGGYAKELAEDAKQREHELLHGLVRDADVVISTALIPGKPAPRLISADMVEAMRPGSVVVDLAAEAGGNCELTKPGEDVVHRDVTILAPLGAASAVAVHASQMYARNISSLLLHLVDDGVLTIDLEDEITRACCITHGGDIVNPAAADLVGAGG